MGDDPVFVKVQGRGVIAIPAAIARRLGLDRTGAQVQVIDGDGEIVLRPHVAVPADQTWFWSRRWQGMERTADEAVAAGATAAFGDVRQLIT